MIEKKTITKRKRWPRVCLYLALGLIVFAVGLYVYLCRSIDAEFDAYEDFYGEKYDELFSLNSADSDITDAVLADANKAFAYIGADTADFGELARYCTDTQDFPTADRCDYTLDLMASGTDKNGSYVWVAYTLRVYDKDGNLLTASGSEDARILSRWTVQGLDGAWTVTEILEQS